MRRLLVADLLKRYATEVSPRKKGADTEQIRLACFERDALGHVPIMRLSPSDIASYRDRRVMLVSGETVRRELALLNSVIQTARTGLLPVRMTPSLGATMEPEVEHGTQAIW
jgi:hypothetical protein